MTEIETREQELKAVIQETVDSSVERAFQKYGRKLRPSLFSLRNLITLVLALALLVGAGAWLREREKANQPVEPVEDHDLTLDNDGIFGFTVADFEEAILGEATRRKLLIVEEQEVYVNTTITETGLFNLGVFNKAQALTIHGTGQYTVDLTEISKGDISLDEETYELTIRIPHAQLHRVSFDPSKTEVGDTDKGWLAFGEIKLNAEQQKNFEVEATEKLTEKLTDPARFREADRFARLSAYETYQPIIRTVSPAYKVVIEFQE